MTEKWLLCKNTMCLTGTNCEGYLYYFVHFVGILFLYEYILETMEFRRYCPDKNRG